MVGLYSLRRPYLEGISLHRKLANCYRIKHVKHRTVVQGRYAVEPEQQGYSNGLQAEEKGIGLLIKLLEERSRTPKSRCYSFGSETYCLTESSFF